MKKIIFFICLAILLYSGFCFAQNNPPQIEIVKVSYLGDFINKPYEPMPGEEPIQLPVEIDSWPGSFYYPPDVIEVMVELRNNSKKIIRNVVLNAKIRYKVGKLLFDSDGIDVTKSMSTSKWMNYSFDKNISIKVIDPLSSIKISVGRIELEKDMDMYEKNKERQWACETRLVTIKPTKSNIMTKVLPIEVIYED